MVAYLYRWKIKLGQEERFRTSWTALTKAMRAECGSLGSRLHLANDGTWVGYAQWPDQNSRNSCKVNDPAAVLAQTEMKEIIEESFPALILDVKDDFLVD